MPNASASAPVITLGQYKGLPVTRAVDPVKETTVHHEVVHQCRVNPNYVPTSRPARMGDRVLIDFEGFFAGEPIPDSRMEQVEAVLSTGTLMPAAEKAICGHTAGETFRFDFTYPEDFRVEALRGQTAQFAVTLHTVAERQIPAPDDAFARSRGYADLNAMHDAIRARLQAVQEQNADRKAMNALLDAAGANLMVDQLPTALLAANADREMQAFTARLQKSGIAMADYCRRSNTSPEKMWANYRAAAERRLRNTLAVRAIAEQEKIFATPAEVEAEYARLAKIHDTPEEEIRRVLDPSAIAASLVAGKVQAFLLANAVVTAAAPAAKPET